MRYSSVSTILLYHDTALLLHEAYTHLRVRVALVLSYDIVELRDRAPLSLCIARRPKQPTTVWVVSGVSTTVCICT